MDLAEGEGSRLIKIGHMVHVARKLRNFGVISNFHNFILNFRHVVVLQTYLCYHRLDFRRFISLLQEERLK